MLAQQNSDSAAAVLGILIVVAVLGLQIYLIYAIIATRQDVRAIRSLLGGAREPLRQGPPQFGPPTQSWGRTVATQPAANAEGSSEVSHKMNYYTQDQEYVCQACGFTTRQQMAAEAHQSTAGRAGTIPDVIPAPPTAEFKTCPDCAEEVRAVARKCRFCGHTFDEPAAPLST